MTDVIRKTLSGNDVGSTGGHQAGILVPKDPRILEFFPNLDSSIKNPRCRLTFHDDVNFGWDFSFIYYNNKAFGGTRNEYRLTGMTRWFRESGAHEGDEVELRHHADHRYGLTLRRRAFVSGLKDGVLQLGGGWKIVSIER